MKSNYPSRLLLAFLLLEFSVSTVPAQDQPELANATNQMSYALGVSIAKRLQRQEADVDLTALAAGLADMQAGKPALTPEQKKAALKAFQHEIKAKAEAGRKIAGLENLKIGRAFLAANAQKEGVKVIKITAPDGSPAEVQYQVLESGHGPSPQKNEVLRVHYEGRLLDGTVFDSSLQRGTPWTGRANDFIAGWTEPLLQMKAGDKWRLFIPPSLGYGEFVPYNIGPQSTLIYDLQLLGIE